MERKFEDIDWKLEAGVDREMRWMVYIGRSHTNPKAAILKTQEIRASAEYYSEKSQTYKLSCQGGHQNKQYKWVLGDK